MAKKCAKAAANPRLGSTGGQAVMEGVMMKSKKRIALAVRRLDTKEINVHARDYVGIRQRRKWLNFPIIRGVISFVESMVMAFSTLTESTEMLGLEEEGATEKQKQSTKALMSVLSAVAVVIGVVMSMALFMYLPIIITNALQNWMGFSDAWRSIPQGVLRIVIFVLYIMLTSLLKDIKRTYMYHGAEHKSIFCYENGEELTVENVKKQKRFHPRCGTSFIFVTLIISIFFTAVLYSFIEFEYTWQRLLSSLVLTPFLVGVSFEFIIFAGKHDNGFTRVLSAPGLWMQRITTIEPDDDMIEVAIISLKTSLIEEFPDFEPPFEEGYDIHGKIKDYKKPEETVKDDNTGEQNDD
ncbi:MAG: DUF1385 domain-containing protein [Clostridia bacterium]|nr:DUF1385 domain-containing protein [Clostridia bacterium]